MKLTDKEILAAFESVLDDTFWIEAVENPDIEVTMLMAHPSMTQPYNKGLNAGLNDMVKQYVARINDDDGKITTLHKNRLKNTVDTACFGDFVYNTMCVRGEKWDKTDAIKAYEHLPPTFKKVLSYVPEMMLKPDHKEYEAYMDGKMDGTVGAASFARQMFGDDPETDIYKHLKTIKDNGIEMSPDQNGTVLTYKIGTTAPAPS